MLRILKQRHFGGEFPGTEEGKNTVAAPLERPRSLQFFSTSFISFKAGKRGKRIIFYISHITLIFQKPEKILEAHLKLNFKWFCHSEMDIFSTSLFFISCQQVFTSSSQSFGSPTSSRIDNDFWRCLKAKTKLNHANTASRNQCAARRANRCALSAKRLKHFESTEKK